MSREVDQRVVQMEFDNARFENNAQKTLSTLEKLKESLNFKGASKGMDDVAEAAKGVDLSFLQDACEAVTKRFSLFGEISHEVFHRLATTIVDAQQKLIAFGKSLTVDQINAGWSKFTDKAQSVRTIMSATGLTVEEVGEQMNRLNWYTDETSAAFTDMTANVGKFTNAGVELDTAVTAMQGITNWGYRSGATLNEMSRAMYNLSQALAVGQVKLMDWKSIENANMATTEFKNTAIQTAVAMGTLKDKGDGLYKTLAGNEVTVKNFNEALKDGWFSSDVLLQTLSKYGDFGNDLADICNDMNMTATQMMGYVEDYKNEVIDWNELSRKTGKSVDSLKRTFATMGTSAESLSDRIARTSNKFKDIAKDEDAIAAKAEELTPILEDAYYNWTNGVTDFSEAIAATGLKGSELEKIFQEMKDSQALGIAAFQAAQEYSSLRDAIDATKDAVSTGWMNVFEKMFGNFEQAKEIWTEFGDRLYDAFAEPVNGINELMDQWVFLGGRRHLFANEDDYTGALWNILDTVKEITTMISDVWYDTFGSIFDDLENDVRELDVALHPDENSGFYRFTQWIHDTTQTIKDFVSPLLEYKVTYEKAGETISKTVKRYNPVMENVRKTIQGIVSALSLAKKAVVAVFNAIKPVFGILGDILKALLGVTGGIGEFITQVDQGADFSWLDSLHDFLEKVRLKLQDIGGFIGTIKKKVGDFFSSAKTWLQSSGLTSFLTNAWTILKNIAGVGVKGLGDALKGLFKGFGNFDFQTVTDLFSSFAAGGAFMSVKKFFDMIRDPKEGGGIVGLISNLKELGGTLKDTVSDTFSKVNEALTSFTSGQKASTLKVIAEGVLMLAGALFLIAQIPSEKLAASLGTISALIIELVGAMELLNKTMKGTTMIDAAGGLNLKNGLFGTISKPGKSGMESAATAMIEMSAAIAILAVALKKIADLDPDKMQQGLKGVTILMIELVAAAKVLSTDDSTKMMKGAVNAILFAEAIKILAKSMAIMAEIEPAQFDQGLKGITILLTELVVSAAILSSNDGTKMMKGAGNALIFAAAIGVLVLATKEMGKISSSQFEQGLTGISVLIGELVASAWFLANFSGEKMLKGAGNALIFAAAVAILGKVTQSLGGMSPQELATGLIGIAGAMAVLVIGLNAMEGTLAGSAAMIVAATALAILGGTMKTIAGIGMEGVVTALVGLAGVFGVVAIAGMAMGPIIPVILGLGAALMAIGGGVTLVGVGLTAIAAGITALSVALTAGVSSIITSIQLIVVALIGLIPLIVKSLAAGLVTIVKALIDALVECVPTIVGGLLKTIDETLKQMVDYVPSIVGSLVELIVGILDALADHIPTLIVSIVNFLSKLFGAIIDVFKTIEPEALLEGIAAVGLMAVLIAALSALVPLIPQAALGVLGMMGIVAEMAVLIAAIGALGKIPGFYEFLSDGGQVLEGVGTAIGAFVGGIVGGFMSGVSSSFPQIGQNLSDFMTNVTPFIEGASKLDASTLDGVNALAETILILTKADLLNGLTSWITGGTSLTDFGKELADFAPYFRTYGVYMSGIDGSVVEQSANAAKALAEMTKALPTEGGIKSWITGDISLADFGQALADFGPHLMSYANSVTGLPGDVIDASVAAANTIVAFAKDIPNEGGLLGWLMGDNDIATFGQHLADFGSNFASYARSVSGIDNDVVVASVTAAEALVGLANGLPEQGLFDKKMSFDDFGDQIKDFGSSLLDYSNFVTEVDVGAMNAATNELLRIVALVRSLNPDQVAAFGSFGRSLADIAENGISGFVEAFQTGYEQVKEVLAMFMDYAIQGAQSKESELITKFETIFKNSLDAIDNFKDDYNLAAVNLMKELITGTNSEQVNFLTTMFDIMTAQMENIAEFNDDMDTAGQTLIEKLCTGINTKATSQLLSITIPTIMASAVAHVRLEYDSFYSAGEYMAEGMANGLGSTYSLSIVDQAARRLAQKAVDSARNTLEVASPSKVFAWLGEMSGEGFVNGLEDSTRASGIAGEDMANSALSAVSDAILQISNFIQNGIDSQPVIRPILDLSEVKSGAEELNSMFGYTRATTINAGMSGLALATPNGSVVTTNNTPTFNIYQQPGENAEDLARRINKIMGGWYK